MGHMKRTEELRSDPNVHYNCAQSVLMPFAQEMGLTEEKAREIGAHFGSGMRHGSACGALSGGLMVLGAAGYSEAEATQMLREFRQSHGSTQCKDLLAQSAQRGEGKKSHCDGLVYEIVEKLEGIFAK